MIEQTKEAVIRLTPRLIQIALQDIDSNVRIAALNVITLVDKTGVLQDEDAPSRFQIAKLIYDAEPRIRKAVGSFVKGLWEERIEELKSEWNSAPPRKKKRAEKAKVTNDEMDVMWGWKALAGILCEVAETLVSTGEIDEGESSKRGMGRAEAVVEALWTEFKGMQNWAGLGDYLLLDHSSEKEDMWLLAEGEEDLLIMVFIACVKQDHEVS
jgi:cohesin complex subunit SA-1/2